MSSDPQSSGPIQALPPVQPPSGRFIIQLFLVPGIIVLVAVLLLLAFRYAIGSGYTPASFLKQLDNDNADIRWRGASDLAQVLKRPESVGLKTDVGFALDLAERLQAAFEDLSRKEQDLAKNMANKPQEEKDAAWRKLRAERNHVRFLAASLGDFFVPVGVPAVAQIALQEASPDVHGATLRRRQAVWALGHMGAHAKEYAKLPADKKDEILKKLEEEAASDNPRRAAWGSNALYYLVPAKRSGLPLDKLVMADDVLSRCARSSDRYLREQVALAISFWEGPAVEGTLELLAQDTGWGDLIRVPEGD